MSTPPPITVAPRDDGFVVLRGEDVVSGPHPTNAAAWRAADRLEGEAISRAENVSEWFFNQTVHGQ